MICYYLLPKGHKSATGSDLYSVLRGRGLVRRPVPQNPQLSITISASVRHLSAGMGTARSDTIRCRKRPNPIRPRVASGLGRPVHFLKSYLQPLLKLGIQGTGYATTEF